MATVSWHSLPAMFFEQAERFREKPFLWAKQDGTSVCSTSSRRRNKPTPTMSVAR